MKTKLICISLFLLFTTTLSCNDSINTYLKHVLENLEKIESATYLTIVEVWQPGDTSAMFVDNRFIKEWNNPMDSTIGANWVWLDGNDATKFMSSYDGNMKAFANHGTKEITTNDFTAKSLPFRPIGPPFFNYTKNIVKYALETRDRIAVELKCLGDSYYFKLVINELQQVEFFGKAYHINSSYNAVDPTSVYELWISKSTNLPYKVRREMVHNISIQVCSNTELNKLVTNNFNVFDYFPKDYKIVKYGENKTPKVDMTGKVAPNWTLNDMHNRPVSLNDFKSKVLLVNITGIGCGACQLSIPFLKKLKDNFSTEDFELVAIESWVRKPNLLQNYANRNKLNYTILSATDDIIENYQTRSAAPVFFVLDEQRVIRKVIHGYGEKTTDKKIMDAINELL